MKDSSQFAIRAFAFHLRAVCIVLALLPWSSSLANSGCGVIEFKLNAIISDFQGHPVDGALVLAFFNDDDFTLISDKSNYTHKGKLEMNLGFSTDTRKKKEIFVADINDWMSVNDCSRIPLEIELIIYKAGYSITRTKITDLKLNIEKREIDVGTLQILNYKAGCE